MNISWYSGERISWVIYDLLRETEENRLPKWEIYYNVKIKIISFVIDFWRNGIIKTSWRNCISRKGVSDRLEKSKRYLIEVQDQDQDSLLVKRRNDNHSPGPVIRELVPSSHQRSELSNTILCIFSGWDQRIGEGIQVQWNNSKYLWSICSKLSKCLEFELKASTTPVTYVLETDRTKSLS